ncbi:MAG: bifunctional DNA-formamidopyrimidine glycosylase/DNA-(apurinic or apyrimidinic site) lyase [Alphaproteobacteria bacterium]|nr:bifunctional DNA-formamidopyrimidine glycosylase/DNA-(apurinic or apyrimidinic site) lyase [Alphaproteobacteria bacterium]
MPELPEVETVRQGLLPVLEGRRLTRVIARRGDLRFPLPTKFAERLTGRRVEMLTRRAKYILAHLDGDEILIMHLGMSGRFSIEGAKVGTFVHATPKPGKHDHIVFETDKGARVTFTDHRRFGMMDLFKASEVSTYKYLAELGPEPLSAAFSPAVLDAALKGKRTPIKAALLDQRVVAGLGNIYVCEALFRAGISPKRMAATVVGARSRKLVPHVKEVLREAIKAGGSTLRDYKQTSGELGYFQKAFSVYDREEEPCLKKGCSGVVRRIVQSGRSTFFCATCQR